MLRCLRIAVASVLLALVAATPALALPPLHQRHDTGQVLCHDQEGEEVDCAAPLYPFQDARFGRDAAAAAGVLPKTGGGTGGFDFTKIANDGSELPESATIGDAPGDWGCTRDNLTGLVWEIKRLDGMRSYQWSYHWFDPDPETNGGFAGDPGNVELSCGFTMQCDTLTYIQYLNDTALCGIGDWRMPGVEELLNIVNYGSSFESGGAMDRVYFNDEEGYSGFGGTWSSDTAHEPPDGQAAWFANFDDGHLEAAPKGVMLPVRGVSGLKQRFEGDLPVCGKRENPNIPPTTAGAFTIEDDGMTATDARTGLSWMRCGLGMDLAGGGEGGELAQCDGEQLRMTWQEAMQQVRERNEQQWLGHDDWRLPNAKELRSIYEARCWGPVVDLRIFPERDGVYWTSTTYDWNRNMAWAYEFWGGNPHPTNKNDAWPGIRLVRGGGVFDEYEGGLSRSVGGAVSGMQGSGLVLQLTVNGASPEPLTVNADGPFTFTSGLASGDEYAVTVQVPPTPFQSCHVANGEGTIGGADVTNVEVTCDAPEPALIEVTPAEFAFDVVTGGSAADTLAISNAGGGFLHWNIDTAWVRPAAPDGGIDCEGDPALIVHDDGTVENARSGNGAWPGGVAIVDKFTPPTYPASMASFCIALTANAGTTSLNFSIVVFDDNGPDGGPGTELGALAATATGIPPWPITTPTWAAYDLSSLYTTIDSGSLYVGIRWQPSIPTNVFVATDESDDRPPGYAGGWFWNWGASGDWSPLVDIAPAYRSTFMRTIAGDAQPLPVGCDDPHGIPWLDVSPLDGSTAAGTTDEVSISINTAGIAPGEHSALLCLDSDDAAGNGHLEIPVSLHLSEPQGELSVTPDALDFGDVPVGVLSANRNLVVANVGSAPLTGIAPADLDGPFLRSSDGSCVGHSFALAPGQSCTLAYRFRPAALGAAQQELAIASDGGSALVALSGNGVAGAAAVLVATSGGGQSTTVGTPFAQPLVVTVSDAHGHPVAGATVHFSAPVSGAGAVLSALDVVTDTDGTASVTASANAIAGSYVVRANVDGVAAMATFALSNTPAAPTDLIFADGFEASSGSP